MKRFSLAFSLIVVACQNNPVHLSRGTGSGVGPQEVQEEWKSPIGVVDTTFADSGVSFVGSTGYPSLRTFLRDTLGNFWVGGNWDNDFSVFKLAKDGKLDENFGSGGRLSYEFPLSSLPDAGKGTIRLEDGSLLLYGDTRSESGANYDFGFLKRKPDGELDTSFGSNGTVRTEFDTDTDEHMYDLVPTQTGGFYALGTGYIGGQYKTLVSKHKRDGSLDGSFNVSGKLIASMGAIDSLRAGALNKSGELVIVGHISYMIMLRLIQPNGIVKITSVLPGTEGAIAMAMAEDSQGRIVVGGLSHYGSHWIVTRFKPEGMLDGSFGQDGILEIPAGPESSSYFPGVYSLHIQPDGKILIAGVLEQTEGSPTLAVARLDENGTIDNTFGSNGFVSISYQNAPLVLTGMQVAPSGVIHLLGNVRRGLDSGFVIAKVK